MSITLLTITAEPQSIAQRLDAPSRAAGKFAGPAAPSLVTQGLAAESGQSFGDLLTDIVNPLQHIPVVGHLYRAVSGDEISPASQIAGGTLFGGPIGGLISLASAIFGELFSSSGDIADAPIKVAARNPARPDIYKA